MARSSNQHVSGQRPENDNTPSNKAVLVEQIAVLKQKLTQQKIQTVEADKKLEMQTQLLATVSHELRTQVGAILNLVEILAETNLDTCQKHYAGTLKGSAAGLLRVLNDVLDHAKIESGKFELVCRNFSPRKLIDAVVETQIIPCQNKGLMLRLESANDLPDQLCGDALRIRQIVSNLVHNAVKFTPAGAIDISISVLPCDDAHELLKITVKDTGIGLSEQLKDQLFTRYRQANAEVSAHVGGTGLGLSICRHLVSMMGGEIGYKSKAGKGAEFWFTVKCKHFEAGADDAPANGESLADMLALDTERTGTILIVEDNITSQMLISTYLEKFGHNFEIVNSGEKALETLHKRSFDVILMDIIMPGIDGLETTRKIRQLKGNARSIAIIALSANAMKDDQKRYLNAGMNACLTKPINAADLFHAIDGILANGQAIAS